MAWGTKSAQPIQSAPPPPLETAPPTIVDPPSPPVNVRLSITLPDAVVARYEMQSAAARIPIEKALSDRLRRCIDFTASRPLYFDDKQRVELEALTGGHLLYTAGEALARIRTVVTVKVGDVEVAVPQQILERAASRAGAFRIPTEEWIRREVLEGLERSCGMRP